MKLHELKSWPEYFAPVLSGAKLFELRHNDRDFEVGDELLLREYNPTAQSYSGRELRATVTYAMYGVGSVGAILPLKGLAANYVILGIELQFQQLE